MQVGNLTFSPLAKNLSLVPQPIQREVNRGGFGVGIYVVAINPEVSDTAAFCETYNVPRGISTNCIIVEAKHADKTWYAACLILADNTIDVNGKVRKYLNARKVSFAPKDTTLALTQMEYGGITPLGLPETWPILIDKNVCAKQQLIIGGGVRSSKILVETAVLTSLEHAVTIDISK